MHTDLYAEDCKTRREESRHLNTWRLFHVHEPKIGTKRLIFSWRVIPNKFCRCRSLQEVQPDSPLPNWAAGTQLPPKNTEWKGGKGEHLQWGTARGTDSGRDSVSVISEQSYRWHVPLIGYNVTADRRQSYRGVSRWGDSEIFPNTKVCNNATIENRHSVSGGVPRQYVLA